MAQDTIILKLVVDDGQLKGATAAIDKQSKSIDKHTKKQKEGTKASNRYNKAEKALYQTNLSASKGFSKMNQTMGGSSGVVAAYATLAANVFALTAAFGALSKAAEFETLQTGLTQLGAASGQTLSVMADGLREITGGAISVEEAMRGAALGVSGGFGGEQLEGLARIAKGASITLGRSLPDAFDRLTRGAIKLEPEILDELGIMVRLDDAVENYAAQIGKTAGSLTQMERRQAFMNAILVQGEAKFGAIADSVDPSPYAKLGATFGDLTRTIFNIINKFTGLGAVVGFLAENMVVLLGVMILFGSTIAGKMLPFLSDTAKRARGAAEGLHEMATAAHKAQVLTQRAMAGKIAKGGVGSDPFREIMGAYAKGEGGEKELLEGQNKLRQGIGALEGKKKKADLEGRKRHQRKINQYNREIEKIGEIIALEQGRGKASVIANNADLMAKAADETAESMDLYQSGIVGLGPTMTALGGQFEPIRDGLLKNSEQLGKSGRFHKAYQKALANSTAWTTVMGNKLKVLGAAFMKALPLIGLIAVVAGVATFALRKIFVTEEVKAYKEQLKKINEVLENQADIARKYLESMSLIPTAAARQLQQFQQISGVVKETNTELKKAIILRKLADKSRPGGMKLGMLPGVAERRAAALDTDEQAKAPHAFAAAVMSGIAISAEQKQINMFGEKITAMLQNLSKEARQTEIAGILEVEDSPEWQFFQSALTSDIPIIANTAAEHFSRVMGKSFKDPKDRAAALAAAYENMEVQLGQVGNAAKGISDGLKESEKEASKFLTTFAKTTKVTELGKQMRSMSKNIKFMKQEMDKLDPTRTTEELGIALSGVGSTVARMAGPQFYNQVNKVKEAEAEIEAIKKRTYRTTQQQEAAMSIAQTNLGLQSHILGGMEDKYNEMVERINEIERAEITTANTLKQIASTTATINKFKNSTVNLAKQENQLLEKKLNEEKKLAKTTIDMVNRQFMTTTNTGEDIKLGEKVLLQKGKQIKLEKLKELSTEEQIHLANELGIDLGLVYSKEQANILITNKLLEIRRLKLSAVYVELQRGAEIRLREIEEQKKLNDLIEVNVNIQKKLQNFREGRGAGLTAAEEAKLKIDAAENELSNLLLRQKAEGELIEAKAELQKVDLIILNEQLKALGKGGLSEATMSTLNAQIDNAADIQTQALEQGVTNARDNVTLVLAETFGEAMKIAAEGDGAEALALAVSAAKNESSLGGEDVTGAETIGILQVQAEGAIAKLKELGPGGEAYAEVLSGMSGIAGGFLMISEAGADSAQKVKGIVQVFSGLGQAFQGMSDAKVAALDQEIAAEEARDGKSKKSVEKLKQMRMKKYQIEKKAFELNKKVQLAGAVVDGMAAIQSALATKPFLYLGIAMGAMATAMTALQIKAIQSQKFAGKPPDMGTTSPGAINIGKRTNKVDVSKQASAGELAYLRGQRGIGTTATNFIPQGGAAGLRRGYATGGAITVGERGPETITPLTGLNVIPANQGAKSQINANFTIHAIDAVGVEEVLMGQQGNIINMIRSAANDYGTEFLEEIDTTTYGNYSGINSFGGG